MLKSIIIVTISVLNLASTEDAYHDELGYKTVEHASLTSQVAAAWNTPGMQDSEYLIMQPASGEQVFLRFIVNPTTEGHKAMTTHGWNATELLVKDPDAMAEQLEDSAFKVIGPAKDLWQAPNAPRAMQALGPSGEVLYLTRNLDFEYTGAIDRVFIMVLAGPSMTGLQTYYRDKLGLGVGEPTPFQISVVSRAQGLSADTSYPLAIARVSDKFLIELDEYPASIESRPVTEGYLPPGTAMVSFIVANLDEINAQWRATPRILSGSPYNENRVAVTVGPAGEWLEMIESSAD